MRNHKLVSISLSAFLAASLLSACTSSVDDGEVSKNVVKVEKTTDAKESLTKTESDTLTKAAKKKQIEKDLAEEKKTKKAAKSANK